MKKEWISGMRDAVPVALGYLTVSFTLGLAARRAGLPAWQGAFLSLITNTSAGQFAGFSAIASGASLLSTAFTQVVVNLRYVLMSSGLTQKVERGVGLGQRLLIAFDVTDELFALAVSRTGPLPPAYYFGMMAATIPCWALGTWLGAALGALMPEVLLNAAGVMLYAMFIAVVVPPCRKSRPVLLISLCAMVLSLIMRFLPLTQGISPGLRVSLIGIVLSAAAAKLFPEKEGQDG